MLLVRQNAQAVAPHLHHQSGGGGPTRSRGSPLAGSTARPCASDSSTDRYGLPREGERKHGPRNGIGRDAFGLHVLHQLQRLVPQPAFLTGTDYCAVCDGIGRDGFGLHVLHQLQCPLPLCALLTGTYAYLDDVLRGGRPKKQLRKAMRTVAWKLRGAGFIISPKSVLQPKRELS